MHQETSENRPIKFFIKPKVVSLQPPGLQPNQNHHCMKHCFILEMRDARCEMFLSRDK